jgi:lysyl-tRNA synthetase class 2
MVETMTAFKNYEYNMELTEEMYRYIAEKVFSKTAFKVGGHTVDFSASWPRIMMIDSVKDETGVDFNKIKKVQEAHEILKKINFDGDLPESIGECMVEYFEAVVGPKIIQPTFIIGHPVEVSPLAKSMASDPRFVERFEIYMAGDEQGDNWTELNDPVELFERFKGQVSRGRGGDEEFHPMDIDFVEMMEYGMPPTTGLGPGIERIAMLMTETEYIDDVIFFPMLKPQPATRQQVELYGKENLLPAEKKGRKKAKKRAETPAEGI